MLRSLPNRFPSWLLGRILEKVTSKECPEKLERLWQDRQKEDCYFTAFEFPNKSLAVIWGYSQPQVRVKYFADGAYGDEIALAINEIPAESLRVHHYFHGNTIKFTGTYDWVFTSIFPWSYVSIWFREVLGSFLQGRFNKLEIPGFWGGDGGGRGYFGGVCLELGKPSQKPLVPSAWPVRGSQNQETSVTRRSLSPKPGPLS